MCVLDPAEPAFGKQAVFLDDIDPTDGSRYTDVLPHTGASCTR